MASQVVKPQSLVDVMVLFKERLSMTGEEFEGYFDAVESETQVELLQKDYMERSVWLKALDLVKAQGGKFEISPRRFVIPIEKKATVTPPPVQVTSPDKSGIDSEPVYKESGNAIQTDTLKDKDYNLAKSMKKYGQLVPCLADAQGNVFDGFHRLKINPDAWIHKHDQIKTPVDKAFGRLIVNFNRRQYTEQEMKNDVGLLAGSGFSAQDIQDITGIGKTTVYKYYPQQLKDEKKVEAGKIGGEISGDVRVSGSPANQTVTIPDAPKVFVETPAFKQTMQNVVAELVECENCHMAVHQSRIINVQGHNFCPQCESTAFKPQAPKPEAKAVKPTETWEHRLAVMSPQHSKAEEKIVAQLRAKGYAVETDIDICLMKTTPDFNILLPTKKVIRGYIDGVVHNAKNADRDEQLRDLLKKRYPSDLVVAVQVKGDSDEEVREKVSEIEELIKW